MLKNEKSNQSQRLDELEAGQRGIIACVNGTKQVLGQRILSLGLVPGLVVRVSGKAPLGDPIQVEGRGFTLSLRTAEAALIQVQRLSN